MFGMWDVQDVECLVCGMLGMWDLWDVGCLECGMLGMLDVGEPTMKYEIASISFTFPIHLFFATIISNARFH